MWHSTISSVHSLSGRVRLADESKLSSRQAPGQSVRPSATAHRPCRSVSIPLRTSVTSTTYRHCKYATRGREVGATKATSAPITTETFADQTASSSTTLEQSVGDQIKLLKVHTGSTQGAHRRSLLVYIPGMDGTGQCIVPQLPGLIAAGYTVRSMYIPANDRSSWKKLQSTLLRLIREEFGSDDVAGTQVTLLGESFGGCLALQCAVEAPQLVQRLVLVNPATSFNESLGGLSSLVAATGFLALFPSPLYATAQTVLYPFLTKRAALGQAARDNNLLSPIDYVPADTAAWRLQMMRETNVSDAMLSGMTCDTLLLASGEDLLLPSKEECARLKKLIPRSVRLILPESGHTPLLEEGVCLNALMARVGFHADPPPSPQSAAGGANGTAAAEIAGMTDSDVDGARVTTGEAASAFLGLRQPMKDTPSDADMDYLGQVLAPWRSLISPKVSGAENLPEPLSKRPILFVGNHTLFGLYDCPILIQELYLRGFKVRGLAHRSHWMSGVGETFTRFGAVKASPMAAYKLLRQGEPVLLFPGGAREVNKRKGEAYKLIWKRDTDFVRMAAKLDAIIVPFAALGADDAYDVAFDTEDILASPFASLVKGFIDRALPGLDYEETIPPITKLPGLGIPSLVPVPRFNRIYFKFLPPVDTREIDCDIRDAEQCADLYGQVKETVEGGIVALMAEREADPEKDFDVRIRKQVFGMLPDFLPKW